MALLEIIQMPDPRLKKPSRKIKHVNDELHQLIADMDETMRKYDGVGLAAVQVGVHKRLFLIRIPELLEEHLDPEEAKELLESDDPDAKKGIYEIVSRNMEDPDAEPVISYVRRSLYWPESTVLINPRIVEKEGAIIDDEGCLSDMGYQAKVERARRVIITAHDIDMNPIQIEAKGLEARCLQHEYDHLDGIIYHDRMIENTREQMHGNEDDADTEDNDASRNNKDREAAD